MGLGHDKTNEDPVKPGNYKDGHGHTFSDKKNNLFHTIMAIPSNTHIKVKHKAFFLIRSIFKAYCLESQSLAPSVNRTFLSNTFNLILRCSQNLILI